MRFHIADSNTTVAPAEGEETSTTLESSTLPTELTTIYWPKPSDTNLLDEVSEQVAGLGWQFLYLLWYCVLFWVQVIAPIINSFWFLIVMLILGYTWGTTRAQATSPDNVFLAYDCTQPANIIDLGFQLEADLGGSCLPSQGVVGTVNKTYTILQVENYQKRPGYSCAVLQSRTVNHCGAASHQTHHPKYSYTGLPMMMSVEDCAKVRDTGTFKDLKGGEHAVGMSTVTLVKYTELGKTTLSGISSWEVNCEGETWKTPDGQTIDNAVVDIQLTITLQEEEFLSNEDEVRSVHDKKMLPCADSAAGCATSLKTYVWTGREKPAASHEIKRSPESKQETPKTTRYL